MTLVRYSIASDVGYMAANMRAEDVNECMAGGHTPVDALSFGLVYGDICYTLLDPKTGNPGAMLGVCPSGDPSFGKIWLLGTDSIESNSVTFLRNSKPTLRRLFDEGGYAALGNYTHADNHLHHRWLKWLGFKFLSKVELTTNNYFYEFIKLGG